MMPWFTDLRQLRAELAAIAGGESPTLNAEEAASWVEALDAALDRIAEPCADSELEQA